MRDSLIGYHMVTGVRVTSPEVSLREAADVMRNCNIRHLPVLREGVLVGVISERDIRSAINLPEFKGLKVEDVMSRDVFAVRSSTPLSEVANCMAQEKYGSAIIVNHKNQMIGIFTTTDALKILADTGDESAIESFLDCSEDYISNETFAMRNIL